jgi:hypothetical protein
MENSADSDGSDDNFPPEKRLEAPNYRLIKAGIATIPDMETLQECVAYENAHQNRTQILRRLKWQYDTGAICGYCSYECYFSHRHRNNLEEITGAQSVYLPPA